jgi:hypothetical protein
MSARSAIPPMTPPTIAPIGVDLEAFDGGDGVGLGPALKLEKEAEDETVDLSYQYQTHSSQSLTSRKVSIAPTAR